MKTYAVCHYSAHDSTHRRWGSDSCSSGCKVIVSITSFRSDATGSPADSVFSGICFLNKIGPYHLLNTHRSDSAKEFKTKPWIYKSVKFNPASYSETRVQISLHSKGSG